MKSLCKNYNSHFILMKNYHRNITCICKDNVLKKLFNLQKFNFNHKYIPLQKLKFEEINFYEPMTKIYEIDNNLNTKYSKKKIFLISGLLYLNLFYDPLFLSQFVKLPLILNIVGQLLLYDKYLKIKKNSNQMIKTIYLLQNGHQILLITEDESVHLINILDIEQVIPEKDDVILLRTIEKQFYLNNDSNKYQLLNEEILNAIREGRTVSTQKSFSNYDRLTIQKLEDEYKDRIKPTKIDFSLDKLNIKKYLSSFNNFLFFKHRLSENKMMNFFRKNNEKENLIKNNEPNELSKIKKKLNIQMYTNEKFSKKFGIEMYKFLGHLNSAKDEKTYNFFLEIIKRTDTPTEGRRIKSKSKKIY